MGVGQQTSTNVGRRCQPMQKNMTNAIRNGEICFFKLPKMTKTTARYGGEAFNREMAMTIATLSYVFNSVQLHVHRL